MKQRLSIQTKFLGTVISAILGIAIFIGGICIYELDRYVTLSSRNLLGAIADREAAQMNAIFDDMEKSVRIVGNYVLEFIAGAEDVRNEERRGEIVQKAEEMFLELANGTNGTVAYYLRFDPALSDGVAGLFYSKIRGEEGFRRFPPTDLSLYERDDVEHVGWFWQPYDAGKPVWMTPYYNQNNGISTISYVIPMYLDGVFLGVVGMDFDYAVLTGRVDGIEIYENGVAHLEQSGFVTYHRDLAPGTPSPDLSEDYLQSTEPLNNGMTLVLSASYRDIMEIRYTVTVKILLVVLLLTALFLTVVILIVRRLAGPLNSLTVAAERMAQGDYDVTVIKGTTKETERLSAAFGNMALRLKEHDLLQRRLAYQDPLTGLRNTTAMKSWISKFEQSRGDEPYGVIAFDLNFLKETNDRFGHDAGNHLIKAAAGVISITFKRSPVFRTGGDEFVAILRGSDLAECEELLARFEESCRAAPLYVEGKSVPLSVAAGVAFFDPATDESFEDVFKRADGAMYGKKRSMKQEGLADGSES